jgi:hypothetical protein
VNVFGIDLTAKINAFFTYTPFDSHACQSYEACTGAYDDWLNRQYIAGSESGGVTNSGQVCQSFVSDTSNTVSTGGNAVATFVPSTWTVTIPGATWIWNAFHVADPAEGETVTFTKTINVTGNPTSASIVIGADDNYEASLNGTQFGADSAFNNFSAGNEDTYNLTSLLHTGNNTLSITVHNLATGDIDPENNPAGLLYKLDVKTADCNAATTTPPSTDNGNSTSNGNGGSTSGGGGGGSSLPRLKISDQLVTVARSSGKVLVTWLTSRPAYGHVIYGIDTGTPYTLDLTKANFGYPSSNPSDPSVQGHAESYGKVRLHAITLSGLTPGKKYRYRIVSHASPAVTTEEGYFIAPASEDASPELAISDEVSGSNPTPAREGGASVTANDQETVSSTSDAGTVDATDDSTSTERVADATSTASSTDVASNASDTESQNAATALALGGLKHWQVGLIVVILLALIGWLAFGRKKNTLE